MRPRSHGHNVGGRASRTYESWLRMKTRCGNPNSHNYHNYGGRGIRFCERWLTFENFLADMGERPEGKYLDRIDNDGDYCVENCRWATTREQSNNRRTNRLVTFQDRTQTITQWERELGVSRQLIAKYIDRHGVDAAMERFIDGSLPLRIVPGKEGE